MGPQLPAKPSLPLPCSLTQYQTQHLEGVCTPTVQKALMRGGGVWPPSDWSVRGCEGQYTQNLFQKLLVAPCDGKPPDTDQDVVWGTIYSCLKQGCLSGHSLCLIPSLCLSRKLTPSPPFKCAMDSAAGSPTQPKSWIRLRANNQTRCSFLHSKN